ncbi:uncharacterized protein LOC119083049 [Bradysia coprophila]|uniref:uncharacterized protein LOC119083049 n=1 Tax=Bradysia coprophila TaxID=38358 RepID=UPI00187D83EF|nr:uncharacterized protein LOC119083049 [Bradysia coprophila]
MNTMAFSWIVALSIVAGCAAQGSLPVLDSCILCSSRTNITCATDPDGNHRSACETVPVLSGCYTRILDGFTLRGCTSDLDADVLAACQNDSELCSICVGESNVATHGCNNLIFPAHRHHCHQCHGAVNGTCGGIPLGVATPCEMFDANDRCYILRTNTTITRGCMSNRGTNCDNPEHCHICEITGCNNLIGDSVPIAPGSAVTNTVSMVTLSTAFIFALAKFI